MSLRECVDQAKAGGNGLAQGFADVHEYLVVSNPHLVPGKRQHGRRRGGLAGFDVEHTAVPCVASSSGHFAFCRIRQDP